MVQFMKSRNFSPEPGTTPSWDKVPVKVEIEDSLEEEHGPYIKRSKPSPNFQQILAALDIIRQGADVVPRSQLNQVLDAELGHGWSSKLTSFDYEPLASASIGQVHRAVTKDGLQVAMKIQYPGVADSIGSDIDNVKLLLDYTNLIPKGHYLDSAMKVAKEELSRECDYELEATSQKRFRDLLANKK